MAPDVKAAVASLSALPSDLSIAHSLSLRDCLIEAGYDLSFDATGMPISTMGNAVLGRVGVFASEQEARNVGYNSTYVESSSTALSDLEESLPEAERAALESVLWGDGLDVETVELGSGMVAQKSRVGCIAQADVAVYGSVRGAMGIEMFVNEITSLASGYTGDLDKVILERLPEYERCMADAGYSVQGLKAEDTAQALFGRYREHGVAPSTEEQEMAVTDFRCQSVGDLAEELTSVFVRKASVWIVENEQRILSLQESLDAALLRAHAILEG